MKSLKKYGWVLVLLTGILVGNYLQVDQLFSKANAIEKPRSEKCCKICKKGKACGDGCINKQLKCHKEPGCACDG